MSDNRTLGTIAGAVLGYFTGGASYVALGATLGGVIGGALDGPTKTEGPRIDDQKVTVSTYGIGIPTVYGTVRLGGNVVDSTDKIELPFTSSSGKGGGGVENTSYRYFVHMRHVLCATPADGSEVAIRKIWKDGKLIYDTSSGLSIGSALASADSPYSNLILYQGHEDQMPDGIEELYHGVGNVPAYRGVVSVRLNIIECPGGRVPQFSFELCRAATLQTTVSEFTEITTVGAQRAVINKDGVWQFSIEDASVSSVRIGIPSFSKPVKVINDLSEGYARGALVPVAGGAEPEAMRWVALTNDGGGYAGPCLLQVFDLKTGISSTLWEYVPGNTSNLLRPYRAAKDAVSGAYVVTSTFGANLNNPMILNGQSRIELGAISGFVDLAAYGGRVYVLRNAGGLAAVQIYKDDGTLLEEISGPSEADYDRARIMADADGIRVLYNDTVGYTTRTFYDVDSTGWTVIGVTSALPSSGDAFENFYCSDSYALVGPVVTNSGNTRTYYMVRFKVVTPSAASVADAITEQAVKAGLSASQFDVSAIDDEMWGYTLTNPASARGNIQPLMTAFAIDATEEDGKIKFFHRGAISSTATIAYEELGSTEDGEEPGDPMPLTRAQEAEMPRSVAVSYINKDFDYQTGTEKAIRQVTESVLDSTIDLPMSVDSGVAATLAQRALYDAWNERNRRSFKVSRKFAYMSAGEVVTVEYPRGTFSEWRLGKLTDTGALIEAECVPANPAIYSQTVVGGSGYSGQSITPLAPPTQLQMLNIPILRDVDNNAGVYVALDSYGEGEANAELLAGYDDNSLTPRGTVSASAPIGFVETVPGAWQRTLIDETSLFIVNIGDDVFNSVTRDVLLSNGGEFWALGAEGRWEIGCSALGFSLGDGRYILSRHLRGLFGTERYTGTHQIGDTFVLLRIAGLLRPSMSTGDIGQNMSYRAVTKGRSTDSVSSLVYANSAEGLTPLSPVNARRAATTQDIQVDRRSRLSMNLSTGAIPLGESLEAYQWVFYTSSAFTTVLATAVTSTSTITAAQQTAAGVTPTATAYLRVAQISDTVGAGHELQAIV